MTSKVQAPPETIESPAGTAGDPQLRGGKRGGRSSSRIPDQPCLNCGDATPGSYCRNCGQAKRRVAVSMGSLLADVLEDQLVLSRALPRTLLYLFVRPGFLTVEYVNGRIVRYIAPFRLYLAASVAFFLLLSFYGLRAIDEGKLDDVNVKTEGGQVLDAGRSEAVAALESIDSASLPAQVRTEFAAVMQEIQEAEDSVRNASADGVRSDSVSADSASAASGLQPWAISLQRDSDSSGNGARLVQRVIDRYGRLPGRDAFRAFAADFLDYVPHMVFLLLPIFALLLKLLYVRRGRFYAEHFVFALHLHAFTFLVFILMFLISDARVNSFLFLGLMLYAWLAMKRVYAQGFLRTTVKYWILGTAYVTVLCLAMVGTLFVTVLLG
ncbi:MAG: DUF3667 domain-containing protein [Longimicrobiales bacterium]